MYTIGDLKAHCRENGVKFTATKNKNSGNVQKITITKTRAVKILVLWGQITWSFWNNNRKNYGPVAENGHTDLYNLEDSKKLNQDWFDIIIDLLNTEPAEKSKPGEFPIDKKLFSENILTRYTNGLVKASLTLTQAYVSGVVKVTNRGFVKEIKADDECDCWFLIDGKGKCQSLCDGRPAKIIYDGEKYYTTIEKTDKSYRIADKQLELSTLDKAVIDAALKLFLTLKEKDQSG